MSSSGAQWKELRAEGQVVGQDKIGTMQNLIEINIQ